MTGGYDTDNGECQEGGAVEPFHIRLATSLAREGETDPFLAHQEGHLKVIVTGTLLHLGHTVHEGSNNPKYGWSATLDGEGRVVWKKGPRVHRKVDGGSTDLASSDPTTPHGPIRLYEMKSYPDHGSKCGVRGSLHEDLIRAAENDDIVVVAAFDPKALLSFSGSKTERRGRKGKYPHLGSLLPPPELLTPGIPHLGTIPIGDVTLHTAVVRTTGGRGGGVTIGTFTRHLPPYDPTTGHPHGRGAT